MNDEEQEYSSLFQGNISSDSESEIEVDFSVKETKNGKPTNIYSQNSFVMEIDGDNTDEIGSQDEQQLGFGKLDPLFENENLGMIQHFDDDDDDDIEQDRNLHDEDNDDEKCRQCKRNVNSNKWCRECNEIRFRELFDSWSTENRDLDLLIQQAQLNSTRNLEVLEFIFFERFKDIELIEEDEEFYLYTAVWTNGPIEDWNALENRWHRRSSLRVTLKRFKYAEERFEMVYDELNSYYKATHTIEPSDLYSVIRCFGISRHPQTNDYIIIYEYAQQWTIHEYIGQNFPTISWHQKLFLLNHVARNLANIHQLSYIYAEVFSRESIDISPNENSDLKKGFHSLFTGKFMVDRNSAARRMRDYLRWISSMFGKDESKSSFEQISTQGISAKIAIMSLKSDNQILPNALAQLVKEEEPKIENEGDNLESEQIADQTNMGRWPSGLRRHVKAVVSSEAWVRIPPSSYMIATMLVSFYA
ncbi:13017_t:CDS:2 [Ambispora gerdemannii]|uniref:13017_t:CDS:1 n=1 Tax=Ambispora gerdemannii TaxID=144530 RepID=A0A9N9FRY9_9GLOM|nr:13017_t:CDS:2 [Ambispora gerdemannii]